jgi:anti-sigma factor RsiW
VTRGFGREPPSGMSDAALWRRSRITDAAENDVERYLDLAGFVDGLLDPDERERVAERLAGDPVAAADVAAARVAADRAAPPTAVPETVIARACALVGGNEPRHAVVIPFLPPRRPRLRSMAGWGSLVAAMVVASWLGFTLGVDTSLSFTQAGTQAGTQVGQAGEDGFLRELLDPANGFMRDLSEGSQT